MADFLAALRESDGAEPIAAADSDAMQPEVLTRPLSREATQASPWALDAALQWADWNVQHKRWRALTWTSAYEPAIRIFTDLIGNERRAVDPAKFNGSLSRWDIRLSQLTREAIRKFVGDLFRYPSAQGRRRDGSDAKQRLEAEDKAKTKHPQTRQNALKTIALLKTFLSRMREHGYVAQEVVDEIAIAAREPRPAVHGGYKSFDPQRGRRKVGQAGK